MDWHCPFFTYIFNYNLLKDIPSKRSSENMYFIGRIQDVEFNRAIDIIYRQLQYSKTIFDKNEKSITIKDSLTSFERMDYCKIKYNA